MDGRNVVETRLQMRWTVVLVPGKPSRPRASWVTAEPEIRIARPVLVALTDRRPVRPHVLVT
jgi:dihydropteroate synthase